MLIEHLVCAGYEMYGKYCIYTIKFHVYLKASYSMMDGEQKTHSQIFYSKNKVDDMMQSNRLKIQSPGL